MRCPKCGGNLAWKEKITLTWGEDVPGHWSCIMCGKIIWPDRETNRRIPETEPVNDETEEENMLDPINCKECGKEFTPRRTDQRWCSKPCRDAAYNKTRSKNGNGRRKKTAPQPIVDPPPPPPRKLMPPHIAGIDAQLAIDLKAMKKRIGQEILQIIERAIEEAFA